MIDPTVHTRQARDARRYVIHVELTGEPPAVNPSETCECGCGRILRPGNESGFARECSNRQRMRLVRANGGHKSGLQLPHMTACESCGTQIQKYVNSNRQHRCAKCKGKGVAKFVVAARLGPQEECTACWTVGHHDPLCPLVKNAAKARAAKAGRAP